MIAQFKGYESKEMIGINEQITDAIYLSIIS